MPPVSRLPSPVILLAALLLGAALLPAGCARRPAGQVKGAPEAERKKPSFAPTVSLDQVSLSVPDAQGRPLWDVKAQKGNTEVAAGTAQLEGVQCKVFADGQPAMDAAAPRVTADSARKWMLMEGGVTARTLDGKRSFRADRLRLTAKEGRRVVLEATGAVQVEVDGMTGTGERLVTDPRLTQGQISGQPAGR